MLFSPIYLLVERSIDLLGLEIRFVTGKFRLSVSVFDSSSFGFAYKSQLPFLSDNYRSHVSLAFYAFTYYCSASYQHLERTYVVFFMLETLLAFMAKVIGDSSL